MRGCRSARGRKHRSVSARATTASSLSARAKKANSVSGQPVPLPDGFTIVIDADTKQLDETTLFGGSPARVMRLSATGKRAWGELGDGPVGSAAAGVLARKLTDAGLAHPSPPDVASPVEVTVVIPVRDRAALLERCLTELGNEHPIVVVDDGSADAQAVAYVAERHGATLLRREQSGGPGVARNAGLVQVSSEFVAFLDSDCIPPAGWTANLAAHFADPLVAAVAPRVAAEPTETTAGHYAMTCGSLDLGDRAARVAPATRVAYVPTAALVVRRAALLEVTRGTDVFDPTLRYGEDVDLVWRLHDAGWRIRYDPAVQVRHREPDAWTPLLTRRFHYGTSAAPLAQRHPAAMAPLVLHPWPTVTVAALLARRPILAALGFAASALNMSLTLSRAGLPSRGVLGAMATAVRQTWLGAGRYSTQFAVPVLVTVLVAPGGATPTRRWGRRAAAASLLLGPPISTWVKRRPALGPVRFTLGHIADDVAYGAGVWAGCVRSRALRPVLPRIAWRPLRLPSTKGFL
jgi:mycofactocin system glycosyltransferase